MKETPNKTGCYKSNVKEESIANLEYELLNIDNIIIVDKVFRLSPNFERGEAIATHSRDHEVAAKLNLSGGKS